MDSEAARARVRRCWTAGSFCRRARRAAEEATPRRCSLGRARTMGSGGESEDGSAVREWADDGSGVAEECVTGGAINREGGGGCPSAASGSDAAEGGATDGSAGSGGGVAEVGASSGEDEASAA